MATDSAWFAAKVYRDLLGPFVPLFTTCIRLLRGSGGSEGNKQARLVAHRLLECPSIKLPCYYAACSLPEVAFDDSGPITTHDLVDKLDNAALSTIFTLVYLFRRVERLAQQKPFEELSCSLHRSINLGIQIGTAIEEIGPADGLLTGGMREIALSCFLIVDEDGFRHYRTRLRLEELPYDLDFELGRWGCTHAHIATLLLLLLGFGVEYSYAFYQGVAARQPLPKSEAASRKVQVLSLWLASMLQTGEAPRSPLGDDYEISEHQFARLATAIPEILDGKHDTQWLSMRIQDLPTQLRDRLFNERAGEGTPYSSLPEQIRQHISSDEWTTLQDAVNAELLAEEIVREAVPTSPR